MKKANIEELLNTPQALDLFRRHHITSTGMAGVREGYDKKGNHFMLDLVKTIQPKSVVAVSGNYGLSDNEDTPSDNDWLAASEGTSGKGWAWWEKLLTMAGKTGTTIAGIKNSIFGTSDEEKAEEEEKQKEEKKRSNIIWIVAGVVVVALIVFLVIKKDK